MRCSDRTGEKNLHAYYNIRTAAGFISHQINLSLALYNVYTRPTRHRSAARASDARARTRARRPFPPPPLLGRNAQFFDIANSPARETKRDEKKKHDPAPLPPHTFTRPNPARAAVSLYTAPIPPYNVYTLQQIFSSLLQSPALQTVHSIRMIVGLLLQFEHHKSSRLVWTLFTYTIV